VILQPNPRFTSFNNGQILKFQKVYEQVVDLTINYFKTRYEQDALIHISKLKKLLLKAITRDNFDDELRYYGEVYSYNRDELDLLETNLKFFATAVLAGDTQASDFVTVNDIRDHYVSLDESIKRLLKPVEEIIVILLVAPPTSASAERSYSHMRLIKTYLRSSMTQDRFINLLHMHLNKHILDKIDLVEIANDFVNSEIMKHRFDVFGTINFTTKSAEEILWTQPRSEVPPLLVDRISLDIWTKTFDAVYNVYSEYLRLFESVKPLICLMFLCPCAGCCIVAKIARLNSEIQDTWKEVLEEHLKIYRPLGVNVTLARETFISGRRFQKDIVGLRFETVPVSNTITSNYTLPIVSAVIADPQPTTLQQQSNSSADNLIDNLEKLNNLHKNGALTDEEYISAKAKVMK